MSDSNSNMIVKSATHFEAAFYREGGIWKLKLNLPEWLIRDLITECENNQNPTIFADIERIIPGTSIWGVEPPVIIERLVGVCHFDLVNVKDKDDDL